MTKFYSNPERDWQAGRLPDCEVIYRTFNHNALEKWIDDEGDVMPAGWYWWACFPGCLPDSGPMGPFDTEEEAIADAQSWNE